MYYYCIDSNVSDCVCDLDITEEFTETSWVQKLYSVMNMVQPCLLNSTLPKNV